MNSKFSHRSYESELLDAPNIPTELLFQNLRELDVVNRTLGGHTITLAGIKSLVTDKNKMYRIVDIGCGGGDAMKQIVKWARKNGFNVQLIGVDMNPDAISYMLSYCEGETEVSGVTSDYRDYLKANPETDIIHCSLFCHHLKDDELIELFQYMNQYARVGFIINDLHRHWFAYYSIKFLTRLLNGSALVKNDAPLSVLRGFKKNELSNLLDKAQLKNTSVKWRWAFRYLVLHKKSA
ncbi:MAG TPA: methyltransferase domain-containing protein [Bacteroidia bacterium]|jgi:2-polyprenyl-3-methyl-5-hydroxy-6-metoxy-1,4-benzoquinol methylase